MTHDERVRHHMYETCEGIAEHAERIASLEELASEMRMLIHEMWPAYCFAQQGPEVWYSDDADAGIRDRYRSVGSRYHELVTEVDE